MTVAALFVRGDSHYKAIAGVDCYDAARNALTWQGGCPGIFHPPCRGWGKLRTFAHVQAGELDLARWSISMCRRFGGVVEHPLHSGLWRDSGVWSAGMRDTHGGVFLTLNQRDFGHRAEKATGLYVVGAPVPALPFVLQEAVHSVERMNVAERERTPEAFARLLVDLARAAIGWQAGRAAA